MIRTIPCRRRRCCRWRSPGRWPPARAASDDDSGGGNVTLNYWLWDDNQQAAYQACADAFHTANPNITIKITQTAWDQYWQNLTTQLAAGERPGRLDQPGLLLPAVRHQRPDPRHPAVRRRGQGRPDASTRRASPTCSPRTASATACRRTGTRWRWSTTPTPQVTGHRRGRPEGPDLEPDRRRHLRAGHRQGHRRRQRPQRPRPGLRQDARSRSYGFLPEWADGSQGQNGWGNLAASQRLHLPRQEPVGHAVQVRRPQAGRDHRLVQAPDRPRATAPRSTRQSTLSRDAADGRRQGRHAPSPAPGRSTPTWATRAKRSSPSRRCRPGRRAARRPSTACPTRSGPAPSTRTRPGSGSSSWPRPTARTSSAATRVVFPAIKSAHREGARRAPGQGPRRAGLHRRGDRARRHVLPADHRPRQRGQPDRAGRHPVRRCSARPTRPTALKKANDQVNAPVQVVAARPTGAAGCPGAPPLRRTTRKENHGTARRAGRPHLRPRTRRPRQPAAADGGLILPPGRVALLHGLGDALFYRHGHNSWSPCGWRRLSEPPLRIAEPAAARSPPTTTSGTTRPGTTPRRSPPSTPATADVLLLGALGLGTPRLAADHDTLAGWYEHGAQPWFARVRRRGRGVRAPTPEQLAAALGQPAPRRAGNVWCSWYAYYETITETAARQGHRRPAPACRSTSCRSTTAGSSSSATGSPTHKFPSRHAQAWPTGSPTPA